MTLASVSSCAGKVKTSRGEMSRQRIIKCTRSIIASTDLSSLKLDRVAEKSGVAKSSILWHFGSKNGLLLAVVEDVFNGMQCLISGINLDSSDKKENLKKMMLTLAEELQRTPEANTLLIAFIVNQTLDQTINTHIKEMYNSYRLFIKNILCSAGVMADAERALNELHSSAILAFIDGAFLQWYLQPDKIDLSVLLVHMIDMLNLEL